MSESPNAASLALLAIFSGSSPSSHIMSLEMLLAPANRSTAVGACAWLVLGPAAITSPAAAAAPAPAPPSTIAPEDAAAGASAFSAGAWSYKLSSVRWILVTPNPLPLAPTFCAEAQRRRECPRQQPEQSTARGPMGPGATHLGTQHQALGLVLLR